MKYSLRSLLTFSIRDLLWLTIVVALALGWWLDRLDKSQLAEKAKHFDAAHEAAKYLAGELNTKPGYEFTIHPDGSFSGSVPPNPAAPTLNAPKP